MTKILVIENQQSIRENILEILANNGFESLGAADDRTGLSLARACHPDLIICDPNNCDVLIELQTCDRLVIPCIFMTTGTQRLGVNEEGYLTKPFNQGDLLEAIATKLNNHSNSSTQDLILSLQTAEEKLILLSQNDHLTGLLNRSAFQARFAQIKDNVNHLAIMIIDLDRFNRININKGYSFADRLLQLVAIRLQEISDIPLARINADEFAFIIINPADDPSILINKANQLAQDILKSLAYSFQVGIQEVRINASIGISIYPDHGRSLDRLMQSASSALRRVKFSGGNNYSTFNHQHYEPEDSLDLELELYKAIELDQLQIYYQPQICVTTGKIKGVEALLRWLHPSSGFVPWHKFIPLAERNGAIIEIGEWVLRTACQQLKIWHNIIPEPITISVNLSARQFQQPNLGTMVHQILNTVNIAPCYLDLEITESTLIQNIEDSITRLNYLKDLGVQISLDDFGTGYSSFSYLQQFPLNTLKIDQGFIRNMAHNPTNKAITTAMIQLGHSLNLKVLAEGVETQAELDILTERGCDLIQGFFFSKALPVGELTKLLQSGIHLPTLGFE